MENDKWKMFWFLVSATLYSKGGHGEPPQQNTAAEPSI